MFPVQKQRLVLHGYGHHGRAHVFGIINLDLFDVTPHDLFTMAAECSLYATQSPWQEHRLAVARILHQPVSRLVTDGLKDKGPRSSGRARHLHPNLSQVGVEGTNLFPVEADDALDRLACSSCHHPLSYPDDLGMSMMVPTRSRMIRSPPYTTSGLASTIRHQWRGSL